MIRTICILLALICLALGVFEYETGKTSTYGYWTKTGALPGGNYQQYTIFIPNLTDVADYGLFFQHGITGRYTYVDETNSKHYFSSNLDLFGLCVRLLVLPNTDWYPYVVLEPRGYMYYGTYNQRGVLGEPGEEDFSYSTKEDMLGGAIGLALGARWRPYGQIAVTYTHHAFGPLDPIGGPKYDRPTNPTIFKGDLGMAIEAWLPEH